MRAHGRHEDARRIKMVAQMVTTKGLELVFVDNTTVEDTIQSQIARMFDTGQEESFGRSSALSRDASADTYLLIACDVLT